MLMRWGRVTRILRTSKRLWLALMDQKSSALAGGWLGWLWSGGCAAHVRRRRHDRAGKAWQDKDLLRQLGQLDYVDETRAKKARDRGPRSCTLKGEGRCLCYVTTRLMMMMDWGSYSFRGSRSSRPEGTILLNLYQKPNLLS